MKTKRTNEVRDILEQIVRGLSSEFGLHEIVIGVVIPGTGTYEVVHGTRDDLNELAMMHFAMEETARRLAEKIQQTNIH